MPICRIPAPDGTPSYALYRDGQVCPLAELCEDVPVDTNLFAVTPDWFASLPTPTEAQWRDAPARLLPPVPPPEKCICIGLNYRDHARETGAKIPTEPVVFSKFASAIIGHGEAIRLPAVSEQVDFEAELVVVIGRGGHNIALPEALGHVFGYTCGHDVSARDWQKGRPGGQWLLGKTFDTFGPIGPCLATAAEITDPGHLRIQMMLNGQIMQDSSTDQLIFDIPTLIAHLSRIVTFSPGDLIFTGTPPGVGVARTPPIFLQPGDECKVQIEQIGTLVNHCESE